MIRIGKLTDYAFILLGRMASGRAEVYAATELAEETGIAMPTVSKVLKSLTRAGVVRSLRGIHGGYALSQPATETSVAAIIHALEGPIAITECGVSNHHCNQSHACQSQDTWSVINHAIRNALESVSLAELNKPKTTKEAPVSLHSLAHSRTVERAEDKHVCQ